MKTCPFCAEELRDAAATCTRCRRELPTTTVGTSQPTERPPSFTTPVVLGVLMLAAVVLALFFLAAPAAN